MAELEAKTNPVIVDREAGETLSATTVSYQKSDFDVLWLRPPGGGWSPQNPFSLTGQPDAERTGHFTVGLEPGQIYDIAIFKDDRQPIDEQVVQTRARDVLKGLLLVEESGNP